MEQKKYYPFLDLLKILAAFLVTFYHLAYYKLDYGTIAGVGGVYQYLPNINRIAMSFACASVPIFFLCSGAQLLTKERTVKYCVRKALKTVAIILIWYITGFPWWFLGTLTVLYLVTPLIQIIQKKKPILLWMGVILLIFFPFLYCYMVPILKLVFPQNAMVQSMKITGLFTSYSIVYYLLGSYLITRNERSKKEEIICGAAIAVVGWAMAVIEVVLNVAVTGVMFDGVNDSFQCIDALLLSSGLFLIAKNMRFSKKVANILAFASKYILPVYLLHSILIKLFYVLIPMNSISLVVALLVTLAIDSVCVLIGWVINKIPYVRELIRI